MPGIARRLTPAEAAEVFRQKADALAQPDMRPLWKTIGLLVVGDVKKNFIEQHDPSGNPWAPLKNPSKKRGGANAKPLRNTGLLFASLSASGAQGGTFEVSQQGLVYGSAIEYAAWQNRGTRTIPARPFLGISARLMERIRRLVADYITKLLEQA